MVKHYYGHGHKYIPEIVDWPAGCQTILCRSNMATKNVIVKKAKKTDIRTLNSTGIEASALTNCLLMGSRARAIFKPS